ncbi:uncharacterized protein PITG_09195 [Phytophthora infestans T30-4]|uniref:Uncharacterized protein n=1 Tax=Phytophthora infestans (strain T30-4) TaxID=403677 RepID=D0NBW5_PHYIT|nr:uncharacterized protein PITG_09195 [Phytophthora infestans T30-4]EEY55270.1 conserved hypothetical protein [Phytophthora infestans T30-4]|eukprot:XP_002903494.1 conserved hypothetical protein [Phytophthora infestans T30-4]
MPHGVELLTLLVEDSHRRLVNRPSEPSEQGGGGPRDDTRSRASSHGTSMLDNQFGASYDDVELGLHTEKMLGKEVPLPKLSDNKKDYDKWKSEVTLRFPTYKLNAITYGEERYNSVAGLNSQKYHTWYDTRRSMAFTTMALSLDMNLREMFKVDELRDQMEAPSLLWNRITAHFTRGDLITSCEIEELVRQLRQANGQLEEWEHASLLISNSQRVFRELAEQHTVC